MDHLVCDILPLKLFSKPFLDLKMAEDQGIRFAPQWAKMTLVDVQFKTNNVVGNFNYPTNVPAYKEIVKFLFNCP